MEANMNQRAPERPEPNARTQNNRNATEKSRRVSGITSKIKYIVLWLLIFFAFLAVMYVAYVNYVGDSDAQVKIYDQFIDLDSDGDQDYLIYGEAIMNCEGTGCASYISPSIGSGAPAQPPAALAPQAPAPPAGTDPN
jgi:hypothetical protein